MRRRYRVIAITLVFLVVAPAAFAGYICRQNTIVLRAWKRHTQNSAAAASDRTGCGTGYVRFYDEHQEIRSHYGSTSNPCGYRDADGVTIVAARYVACAPHFSEGLAWVRHSSGSFYYIDCSGTIRFELDAIGASDFREGLAAFRRIGEDGWPVDGFVNSEGDVVVPPIFISATGFVDGVARVSEPTILTAIAKRIAEAGISVRFCAVRRMRLIDKQGGFVSPDSLR